MALPEVAAPLVQELATEGGAGIERLAVERYRRLFSEVWGTSWSKDAPWTRMGAHLDLEIKRGPLNSGNLSTCHAWASRAPLGLRRAPNLAGLV